MDQKKTGQEWFKEAMPPGSKACLIREEPHYLKTQARSPIFGGLRAEQLCYYKFEGPHYFSD